jgi:hypothetical protein
VKRKGRKAAAKAGSADAAAAAAPLPPVSASTFDAERPAGVYSLDLARLADLLVLQDLLHQQQTEGASSFTISSITLNAAPVSATQLQNALDSAAQERIGSASKAASVSVAGSTRRKSSMGSTLHACKEYKVQLNVTGSTQPAIVPLRSMPKDLAATAMKQLSAAHLPASWKVCSACTLCSCAF